MKSLFVAEWRKVSQNVWLTMFTVWLPAYGVAIVTTLQILATLTDARVRESYEATNWLLDTLGPWALLNGEVGAVGRILPLMFMAMVLAEEYQSGMWKNVLPGNQRWQLWVAKYGVLLVYVLLSYMAFSLLSVIFNALLAQAAGNTQYLPEFTLEVLQNFGQQYRRELLLGMATISLLIWVAGTAAVIGRSVMVSLGAAIFFSLLDATSPLLLGVVSRMLHDPELMRWAQLSPSLSVTNIRYWVLTDAPMPVSAFMPVPEMSLAFSVAVLALWSIGLMAVTLLLFQRQDITQ